jgi:glycosyltransferase involved in cell wall biosynthesis
VLEASRPKVVLLWRAFLPYHRARLAAAIAQEERLGVEFHGLQAVDKPTDYEFLGGADRTSSERITACFPGSSFGDLNVRQLFRRVFEILENLSPIAVFCPSPAFPEGMAAINWRARYGGRVYLMDDSWELTDPSGFFKRTIKRIIHRGVDGVLAPADEYQSYWQAYGVPAERVFDKVHVVDNAAFERPPQWPRAPRFLFVGRDLPRKGLGLAIDAYAVYRQSVSAAPWEFHIVGPHNPDRYCPEGVRIRGPLHGRQLHEEFWNASAFIMPSDFEQWGLVINEAMAAELPVIASRGVGAARSLIIDGITGWTFEAQNRLALSSAMSMVGSLTSREFESVTQAALKKITTEYSLNSFVESVERALAMPRRGSPGWLSKLVLATWHGRMNTY